MEKRGFTLAEVLITLAIIGVVAALTISPLIKHIEELQYKSAWKKGFSEISNVYNEVKQDEGGSLNDYFGGDNECSTPLVSKFISKFKTLKKCNSNSKFCGISYSSTDEICTSYKDQGGNVMSVYYNFGYGAAILADGSTIFFRTYNPGYAVIWMDVNSYNKKPNVLGKDLFGAIFTKDWIKPIGADGAFPEGSCAKTGPNCSGYGLHSTYCAGVGCSALYLKQ